MTLDMTQRDQVSSHLPRLVQGNPGVVNNHPEQPPEEVFAGVALDPADFLSVMHENEGRGEDRFRGQADPVGKWCRNVLPKR